MRNKWKKKSEIIKFDKHDESTEGSESKCKEKQFKKETSENLEEEMKEMDIMTASQEDTTAEIADHKRDNRRRTRSRSLKKEDACDSHRTRRDSVESSRSCVSVDSRTSEAESVTRKTRSSKQSSPVKEQLTKKTVTEKDACRRDSVESTRSCKSLDSRTSEAESLTRKTRSKQSSPIKDFKQEEQAGKKDQRKAKRKHKKAG